MPRQDVEIEKVLLDENTIQRRVAELGGSIQEDYQGESPLFVCVLRGAAIFHADLIRNTDLNLLIDFISVRSYGTSTKSSGEVQLIKDLEMSVHGRDVVLVEDIVDTGLTLDYLLRNLQSRRPRSLRVCSFLSKPARREISIDIDYLGFEIPDHFVVGYGLDFDQKFRNLPFIAQLKENI
jgi:hypoxanthine phosphoribosyltransferase